jgi:hypothetical protein
MFNPMWNKNNFFTGVVAGLDFPAIAALAAYLLRYNVDIINRPALPYFIAVGINLILIRVGLKKGFDESGKGVMLTTFVCMLLVLFFKMHPGR